MSLGLSESRPVKRVFPGDVDDLWCSRCGRPTPHVYGWHDGHWLTCLQCHPQAKDAVDNSYGH